MSKMIPALICVSLIHACALAGDLQFKKHVINDQIDYSAAALIDVDHDGRIDVVCGDHWYRGGNWKQHAAADIPRIGGRPDGFAHLEFDVNRDGWTDVITVNYRSRSIKWMEHPGNAIDPWTLRFVAEPGAMETGRLVDVDGDGQLDLLPNGRNFAAWWEFRWQTKTSPNEPAWIRHELPNNATGHGVGFGDIDGDGRGDIVGQNGWLKSPTDRRAGHWLWNPEFSIERGSVPILVVDPDRDGDNDLVWCSAHGFGVYWLEQTQDDSGNRIWERHAIDTSWSQGHAPIWADLDGDGHGELIAGKRYLSHGGSDPGAFDPLVVYRYQCNPETKTWDRWLVSAGDRVGLGLDPKVGDIDSDGDLDLLACGRSGLYWLENQGPGTTVPNNENSASESREVWGRRRCQIASTITATLGGLAGCRDRVPLQISTTSQTAGKNYRTQQIQYSIDVHRRASATLFVPNESKTAKTSGIVCLDDSDRASPANQTADRLASLGYVCIIPKLLTTNKRDPVPDRSTIDRVWQTIRAADVLQATPEVHGERIGLIADAGSGRIGLITAGIDQRFVATSIDLREFSQHTTDGITSHSPADLISIVAPRRLRIILPQKLEAAAAWQQHANDAIKAYDLSKASKRLSLNAAATDSFSRRTVQWLPSQLPAGD